MPGVGCGVTVMGMLAVFAGMVLIKLIVPDASWEEAAVGGVLLVGAGLYLGSGRYRRAG